MRGLEERETPQSTATDAPALHGLGRPALLPVRWWVFLLGAGLVPVNSLWIARTEALDYSGFPTNASLFFNVIFSLLVLMLLCAVVRRIAPRWALNQPEYLVLYAMIVSGSSLVGHDTMQMLVPSIPHSKFFATASNNWEELIVPNLPGWMTINTASTALTAYETGNSTLYTWENFRIWVVPGAAWTAFMLSILFSQLAINILLRKQWVESERLTYPVIQIPLLITENGGVNAIFRARLFWYGCALAAGIDILNGLQQFFPLLPYLSVKVNDISGISAGRPPWSAVGYLQASFYPWVIGLSYFLPTTMAFSCWFFFFFRKAQHVAAAALGYQGTDQWYPYVKEQAFGALIALLIGSLWVGRSHVARIWREVVGADRQSGEGYRIATAVLLSCVVVAIAFLTAAGLALHWSILYVVLYLMFTAGLTRVRAEVGPPDHQFAYVGPSHILVLAAGTAVLGPKSLSVLTMLWYQNRMHRGILMPHQAECLKAASQAKMPLGKMVLALGLGGLIGVPAAFWALLHLSYSRTYPAMHHPGAPGSGFPQEAFTVLTSYLTNPVAADYKGVGVMLVGACFALFLKQMNLLFMGFPFHPAGYAVGMAFGLDMVWCPILVSWAVKVLILRYTGLSGYRRAIPFFVGLVVGEFVVGGMWSFLRGVFGIQTYTFYY